jgi:hypothetical protein
MLKHRNVLQQLIEYLITKKKVLLDWINHLNSPRTSINTVDARRIIILSIWYGKLWRILPLIITSFWRSITLVLRIWIVNSFPWFI